MNALLLLRPGGGQHDDVAKGSQPETSGDDREIAAKCRRLADCIRNNLIAKGLRDLADEYEIKAVIDAQLHSAAASPRQPT